MRLTIRTSPLTSLHHSQTTRLGIAIWSHISNKLVPNVMQIYQLRLFKLSLMPKSSAKYPQYPMVSVTNMYKAYWKDKPKCTSSTAVAVTTQCEIESKQSTCWHAHKVAVSGLMFSPTMLLTIWQKLKCRKIAHQAANNDIQSDNWTWFFQVLYQSSDESAQEDSLDPNTNIEENVLVLSVCKPWVHCQPTYQLPVVSLSVYYMK